MKRNNNSSLTLEQRYVSAIAEMLKRSARPHAGHYEPVGGGLKELATEIATEISRNRNISPFRSLPLNPFPERKEFEARLNNLSDNFSGDVLLVLVRYLDMETIASTYGSNAAEIALGHVAAVISRDLLPNDFATRFDAGSFAIAMPKSGATKAHARAKRLKSTLNSTMAVWNGNLIVIKTSINLRELDSGDDLVAALNRLDKNSRKEVTGDFAA